MALGPIALLGTLILSPLSHSARPSAVDVPAELRESLESFEPSAILYSGKLGRYIVASDDTDEDKSGMLFTMDERGQVGAEAITFPGLKKMTDIESLSEAADGSIYALSSQGLNKNGKLKKERNLLAKIQLGSKAKTKTVELRPLLLDALLESSDPLIEKIQSTVEEDLDIEASFIRDGNLYVGLKNPQPRPQTALVLSLGPVDSVMKGDLSGLAVWKSIDLKAGEAGDELSDLAWHGGVLYFTTTTEEGSGRAWAWDLNGKPKVLREYEDLKPEGITLAADKQSLVVVFDQGTDGDGMLDRIEL